jgi:hypothetical protein
MAGFMLPQGFCKQSASKGAKSCLRRQPLWLRAALALLATAFAALTLWLLGAFAFAGQLVGWDEPCLRSPLGM